MQYADQERYLKHSRILGATMGACVLMLAAVCLTHAGVLKPRMAAIFGLAAGALAVSIYYTPDYLYLTVNPEKPARWETKIRWRLIGAVLVLGLLSISHVRDALVLLGAVFWLASFNLAAIKLAKRRVVLLFWVTDFVLLGVLLMTGSLNPLLGATVLFAAAAHPTVVIADKSAVLWAVIASASGCLLLLLVFSWRPGLEIRTLVGGAGLLLASAFATALLVARSQRHNEKNTAQAMRELMAFTGYSAQDIRRLWLASNQELARNWTSAAPPENDAARLAEWYRENSRLYLFAISAYNLEYKRIRSNLKVLRLAHGSCLDYGAGNGESVLELARRGHPAVYYDVEGETMRFALSRALQEGLDVRFLHTKQDLAACAEAGGFDTVSSFDVLEHLPDLPGELDFLASLLNAGGLLVFDVPAGSTKAHPMHLNHCATAKTPSDPAIRARDGNAPGALGPLCHAPPDEVINHMSSSLGSWGGEHFRN